MAQWTDTCHQSWRLDFVFPESFYVLDGSPGQLAIPTLGRQRREMPAASGLARLPLLVNSVLNQETQPQWTRWRATREDSWCQPLASTKVSACERRGKGGQGGGERKTVRTVKWVLKEVKTMTQRVFLLNDHNPKLMLQKKDLLPPQTWTMDCLWYVILKNKVENPAS